jgi:hypothetical protein
MQSLPQMQAFAHLKEKLEPVERLLERPVLAPLFPALAHVTADSKAMLDAGEQVDLVSSLDLRQLELRLVTQLGGENGVSLCNFSCQHCRSLPLPPPEVLPTSSSNRQRLLNSRQLLQRDKARVRVETRIDLAGEQTGHVFRAEAVSDGADLLGLELALNTRKDGGDDGRGLLGHVVLEPVRQRQTLGPRSLVDEPWVAVEEVRHHNVVAVGREAICQELRVDKAVADDVGDEEDHLGGGTVRRGGDVGFNYNDANRSVRGTNSTWRGNLGERTAGEGLN